MSERYWVFQNNQVVGPYGIEELVSRSGFSGETLVCPEGRQGTDAGDWQRASLVSQVMDALSRPKSPSVPFPQTQALQNQAPANESLVIKELTLLGAVHEKIGALAQSVAQMQESSKRDQEELSAFRSSFEEKDRQWSQWSSKLQALEGASSAINSLKESVEKNSSESQARATALEEITRSQHRIIEELSQKIEFLTQEKQSSGSMDQKISEMGARLEDLASKMNGESQTAALSGALGEVKALVEGLKGEISEIKSHQEQIQSAAASPEMYPAAQVQGTPSNFDFAPSPFAPTGSLSGSQEALNSPAPFEAAARFEPSAPSGSIEFGATPPAAQSSVPAESSPEFILPTMGGGLESPASGAIPQGAETAFSPATLEGLASSNLNADASLVESPVSAPQNPKKTKKRAWLFIVLIAGGALAALAYVLGLIPGLGVGKPKPVVSVQRLSPPSAPSFSPPAQNQGAGSQILPQGQEEAFKNSAIRLVQNWPVGKTGQNISEALGASVVSQGNLSPWAAEKIRDNLYQVTYYAAPSGPGAEKSYEFEADMGLQKVVGQNQAAVALLSAKSNPPPAAKKAAPKRPRVLNRKPRLKKKRVIKKRPVSKKARPKKSSHGKDILPGIPHPKSAVKTSASSTGGSLPGYSKPASPAPVSQSPAPAKPSEDQAVDQLLKP